MSKEAITREGVELLAQQYLVYGRVTATTAVVLGLVLLFAAYKLGRAQHYKECLGGSELISIGAVFLVAAGMLLLWVNVPTAILVWLAPELWTLKQLAQLVK